MKNRFDTKDYIEARTNEGKNVYIRKYGRDDSEMDEYEKYVRKSIRNDDVVEIKAEQTADEIKKGGAVKVKIYDQMVMCGSLCPFWYYKKLAMYTEKAVENREKAEIRDFGIALGANAILWGSIFVASMLKEYGII